MENTQRLTMAVETKKGPLFLHCVAKTPPRHAFPSFANKRGKTMEK